MRWNHFRGGVLFAAAAGLGCVPFMLALTSRTGVGDALAAYALLTSVIYVGGVSAGPRRGWIAALAAGVMALAVWLLPTTPRESILAAAGILAVTRSGLACPGRGARVWAIEAVLGALGLAFAATLAGSNLIWLGLSIWSFYLVQSVFCLVGGARPSPERNEEADPFDVAHARVVSLIEGATL
jgi:hypothetical protein